MDNIRKYVREDGGFDLTAKAGETTRVEKFDKHGKLLSVEMHHVGHSHCTNYVKTYVYMTTGPVPRLVMSYPVLRVPGYPNIRSIIPDPDCIPGPVDNFSGAGSGAPLEE